MSFMLNKRNKLTLQRGLPVLDNLNNLTAHCTITLFFFLNRWLSWKKTKRSNLSLIPRHGENLQSLYLKKIIFLHLISTVGFHGILILLKIIVHG